MAATVHAAEKAPASNPLEINFRTAREGTAMINVYRPDGTLVRRLEPGQHFTKGAHKLVWDGKMDDGKMAEPGDYAWKGLFHEGIGLKLRGWVANGGGLPWVTPDGKGGWGGDRGEPSAVAADDKKVYLGWSLAEEGKAVLACDLEGRVQWGHRRSEGASGCKALAVDDGLLYVLGGLEGTGANGGTIYRLNAQDGTPVPWPSGAIDLKISSFWPADGKTKPDTADAMAVRHGHIYLSFTSSQFLTVLDAKTGDYCADRRGGRAGDDRCRADEDGATRFTGQAFGCGLCSHFAGWRRARPHPPGPRSFLGHHERHGADGTRRDDHRAHRHRRRREVSSTHRFRGFGAPIHQVQARPILDVENPTWIAGRKGGRPLLGPWQANEPARHSWRRAGRGRAALGCGGDAYPKRFSVWDTTGTQGKLVREFFGPAERGAPGGAINPLDPDVMFAQGCEWRIDRKTGIAKCLGVVIREPVARAQDKHRGKRTRLSSHRQRAASGEGFRAAEGWRSQAPIDLAGVGGVGCGSHWMDEV